MSKPITRETLGSVNGLTRKRVTIPSTRVLNVLRCKKIGTWPEEMPVPEVIVFCGQWEYIRTAQELAVELGTTPRQISKLRSGRIQEAKPLEWYDENNMKKG